MMKVGAHGRNAEEIVDRVRDCGQDPMAALVSANSLAAETLGLQNKIGSISLVPFSDKLKPSVFFFLYQATSAI